MKKLNMVVMTAVLMALMVPAAFAQLGAVKGTVKGIDGKPFVGTVELVSRGTGKKYDLKLDKNGNFFSLGITVGSYDVVVLDPSGKQVYNINGFPVQLGSEPSPLNIDLQELAKQQQGQMSEAQKKQQEAANAERQKIKGLNDMLAQAKAASDAGNYDQAKDILTQATQMDATHEVLWFALAEAQRNAAGKQTDAAVKKTDYQQAVESYNKALSLTPATKPDVLGAINNQMGEAYFKMGDTDNAIKAYDAAATADPPNAGKYYFNEGAVLTNAGKYDQAIAAFDKCIQADPTRADAYYQKGVNLIGKATMKPDGTMVAPEGTSEAFNKYLELDPNGKYADGAKQMLAAIGAKVETTFGKGKTPAKKK